MSAFSKFLRTRRSPSVDLVLPLLVGGSVLVVASAIFALITLQVTAGAPLTMLDVQIADWLHAQATPVVTGIILVFTHLHGITAISCWTAILGAYLARRRDWHWLLLTAVAVPGVMLFNVALKYTFQRHRPSFEEPLLTLSTYSFPSGHMSASTVFYGVLAAYLWTRVRSNTGRLSLIMGAVLLSTLVGMSRMYLGVHYFTDIIAAAAEGCAWLALTLTTAFILRRHPRH